MIESTQHYTKEQIENKISLVNQLLEIIDTLPLENLKEEYLYYSREPLFKKNYDPYDSITVKNMREEDKETLRSYFKLGLNMYKAILTRYDYLDIL